MINVVTQVFEDFIYHKNGLLFIPAAGNSTALFFAPVG
jgi:hypothetical protein